ncbi:hypothetical protein M9458_014039, partial [Cirrhinus mrigala]
VTVAAVDSDMAAVVSVALQDTVVDQDTEVAPSAKAASPLSAVNAIKEKPHQPIPSRHPIFLTCN